MENPPPAEPDASPPAPELSSLPPSDQPPANPPEADPASSHKRPVLWQGKLMPAFWTIACIISLSINIVLIVVLVLSARQLFAIKGVASTQLVSGLHENFIKMDQAHIKTTINVQDTIQVEDTIPVVFNLPLNTVTTVKLTEDTRLSKAAVFLNGSAVPLDIVLRKGTLLPIKLEMTIPVSQTVPVVLNVPINLQVPVDIALNQTELHEPFVGLQNVVAPFDKLLAAPPNSWDQMPLCRPGLFWLCNWLKGQ
jgi:hypothetical protein